MMKILRPGQIEGINFSPVAEIDAAFDVLKQGGIESYYDTDDLGDYEFTPFSIDEGCPGILMHYLHRSRNTITVMLRDGFEAGQTLSSILATISDSLNIPRFAFHWIANSQDASLSADGY